MSLPIFNLTTLLQTLLFDNFIFLFCDFVDDIVDEDVLRDVLNDDDVNEPTVILREPVKVACFEFHCVWIFDVTFANLDISMAESNIPFALTSEIN